MSARSSRAAAIRSTVALTALVGLTVFARPGVAPLQAQGGLPTRLLTEADLIHQGSFTIPDMMDLGVPWADGGAPQPCAYTQGVIAFNAANNSLFIVCNVHTQTVAEISIPAPGGQANQLQAPRDPTEGRLENTLQPPGGPAGSKQIGGMTVVGNQLIISAFVYYDADFNFRAIRSHFVRSTNLTATGTLKGPFKVGSLNPAFYAGYMNPIPTVWQSALGGDFFSGQCCLGIVSRTSYGPSVSAVRRADLVAALNPTSAQHLVGYPEPTVLAPWESTGPLFNGTTNMRGVLLPEGTASVVFFGYHGMGPFIYQGGTTAAPYEPHLWFYSAHDLAGVKAGTKQWHEPRPYRTARLPGLREASIGGVALDPVTGRIFVAENYGDGVKPRIHVFTISGSVTPPPPFGSPDTPSAPRLPVRGDFNDDGRVDILWQHTDGWLFAWFMEGTRLKQATYLTPAQAGSGWQIVSAVDLDGDGDSDLLWHHPSGALSVWLMQHTEAVTVLPLDPPSTDPTWHVKGSGDFNGDGKADFVWQQPATGAVQIWFMNGTTRIATSEAALSGLSPQWHIVGADDIDGDGHIDVIAENADDRSLRVWFMNGAVATHSAGLAPGPADPAWHVVSVADFNDDGRPDVLWEHGTGGYLYVWYFDRTQRLGGEYLTPMSVDPAWHVVGGS